MKYIDSTYEMLAFKALNRDINEMWVDWAIQVIASGFESEHLLILASISKPYNQFYLQDLTSKVLAELSLDISSMQIVIYNYVVYLVSEVKSGNRSSSEVLKTLKDIYLELNFEESLRDFYLLSLALEELKYENHQMYWPGGKRGNINFIISDYFEDWIKKRKPIGL